jgi:hypothetical protein
VQSAGLFFPGLKSEIVCRSGVRCGVRLLNSEAVEAGIPIGTSNPGVKIRDLSGQSGRFQANHALFVVHDRFGSPIRYIWLRGWYEKCIVVSGAGLLAGLCKKSKSGAGNSGVHKIKNIQNACGV